MFEKFDFTPGVIINNSFGDINNMQLNNDNDDLQEDMLQVEYPNDYLIDAGWYGGIDKFIIFLIKDCDWDNPIIKEICVDWDELEKKMEMVCIRINNLINKGNI